MCLCINIKYLKRGILVAKDLFIRFGTSLGCAIFNKFFLTCTCIFDDEARKWR